MSRRYRVVIPSSTANLAKRLAQRFSKHNLLHATSVQWPTLVALTFTSVAHAQGTMDFSGATTLMATFNTAMYDKAEQEDLSEFKPTPYWEAIENFQKYIVNQGRKGLPPARLAKAVYTALTMAKPKARYAVVPQSFKNWTLPRLLPTRMVDDAIAKQMGFIKK